MKTQKYIIRSDRAGVFFGEILSQTDTPHGVTVELANVRKAHGWDGACAVEELALNGPQKKGGNNRWTVTVPKMTVTQAIQIIPCSDEATAIMDAMPEWKIKS